MPLASVPLETPDSAPPRRRRGNARAAILDAARECFERDGVIATTIVDIAAAAGYSRPVIYRNFADKAAIVDAVCIERMTVVRDRMLLQIHPEFPLADQLAEAIFVAVMIARSDPFLQRYNQDEETWRRSQRRGAPVREWAKQLWMTFLRRLRAEGHIIRHLDLDTVVTWLLLVQSQLTRRYSDDELDEDEIKAMIRFSIAPILNAPAKGAGGRTNGRM